MKKIIILALCLILLIATLTGCMKKYVLEDGVGYKNPSLSLSYESSEKVNVTFSAELLIDDDAEIKAHVVLLSEGCVIGNAYINLYCTDKKGVYTANEVVTVTHHNYGAITAYVNKISAFYYDL